MTTKTKNKPSKKETHEASHHEDDLEEYAGGYIQAHHGSIPAWLLVVYFTLFGWSLFYLYKYWGGLGPGLDYTVK